MNPAIAVTAYNRPESLRRLLDSLERAEIPAGTPIIISVDPGGAREDEVMAVAKAFTWPKKRIVRHTQHMGLVGNVYFAGDLACEYGAVIRLEDDYSISPVFYHYAVQALAAYAGDDRIAGVSLFMPWFHGFTHQPWQPYLDDGDAVFIRVPWSYGQAYTARMWQQFTTWRDAAPRRLTPDDDLHPAYLTMPPTDWFGLSAKYLVETGRFYIFPRESQTINWGEIGTHFDRTTTTFQVPMQTRRRDYRFQPLDACVAVYDAYMEMLPSRLNRITDALHGVDYDVDLYGSKSTYRAETVLTTQFSRHPLRTFGRVLRPIEANIGLPGRGITLTHRDDIRQGRLARFMARHHNERYFRRGVSLRHEIAYRLGRLVFRE